MQADMGNARPPMPVCQSTHAGDAAPRAGAPKHARRHGAPADKTGDMGGAGQHDPPAHRTQGIVTNHTATLCSTQQYL